MAIELAVPANAGSAWFLLGHRADGLSIGIAGYAVLMLITEARLFPRYIRLTFTLTFWSFAFPSISAAALALRWIVLERPAGAFAYAWILIGLVSALTAAIALRSVRAIAYAGILPVRDAMGIRPDGGGHPSS
jgi:tellurite resistance protein